MPDTTTTPTSDDIEKVIQMATQAAQSDGRTIPLRDTRTQLFVANLPYRVRWQDLKDLFRRAGTVLRAVVSLGPDNRSRGYGTVLLATAEDAGRAVDMFSGYSWQGRILEVRADRVRDFDQPFPELEEEYAPMGRNLFVGNLPFHVQWQDLKDLFRQAGTIVRADVALGPDGRSRGFGTVVFATEKDARRAVSMFSGYEFNGRTLKVHYDKFSPSPQPPFDLTASFDLGLTSDYATDVFTGSQPLLQPRPFDVFEPSTTQPSLIQLQSQLQQLQLEAHAPLQPPTQTHFQPLSLDPQPPDPPLSLPISAPSSTTSSSPNSVVITSSTSTSVKTPTTPASAKRSPASPHPHHPGPIALPPPPSLPADPSAVYPANVSTNGAAPAPAFNPPAYALTPVGLPPITPSMPPFSFHPMPMPSPGAIHQQQPTSYFGMSPATPTHAHFLNMTPLATPTSPHFPAYIINPAVLPSPGPVPGGVMVGPPSVGALSPGTFWGRAGEGGSVFGAPGPVGQPPPGQVAPVHPAQHPAFAHHFGGSPGVFGMHPLVQAEEPKGYFDFAPSAMITVVEKEILKPSGEGTEGVERKEKEIEMGAEKEKEDEETTQPPTAGGASDATETQSQADADEVGDGEGVSPPLDAFKTRRHSSHDKPPPTPREGGRRAPPPPLQLPTKTGSR